jgi:putrescine aminotransferase
MNRSTRDWQELDARHYLHPFTDFRALAKEGSRVITHAEGVYLHDSEGRRILDAMSGLWCVNIGYGRAELADVAARQMRELPYYNSFFKSANPPAIELARVLAELTPPQFNRVFFTNSGSEANDTILRMTRRYWDLLGQPRGASSSAASTATTAAPWRARASAAWPRCTRRAGCRSRTSCTSSSRTGTRTAWT